LSGDTADATTVTIISVRAVVTDESLSTSLVTASLAEGRIELAFSPSLPPGAYDLVIRLTRPDGSTIDLQLTVLIALEPDFRN
jgi:hypothetical protein